MRDFSVTEDRTKIFAQMLKVLNSISSDCLMIVDREAINFIVVDDTNRCLVVAKIKKKLFPKWSIRKKHVMSINIDVLKKVTLSNNKITSITEEGPSSVRLALGDINGITLTISKAESSDNKFKMTKLRKGDTLLSLKVPTDDFVTFLKTVSQIADDIKFTVNNKGLTVSVEYLNYVISKGLIFKNLENNTKMIEFIVPARYLKALIPVLNITSFLYITLTEKNIAEFTVGKRGLYKIKMWVSSGS